jgi:energy-coupling factor transporter ATP-binding protein EcfA2
MAAGAVFPTIVVITLGLVVGAIPGTVEHGIGSAAGHRLITALVLAALVYGLSLIVDPVGNALGTAASARITGQVQERLLTAVAGPVGVSHLEDTAVLDRLARAEGSLTGFFPGDAPVTWAGSVSGRVSGVIGCLVVAVFQWWLGLLLLVMWLVVRRTVLTAVLRQAIDMRARTIVMRRSWYFVGVGSKARDVTFGYPGTERAVLSSLTVTLAAGCTVALVGDNGSGKTTLVKLLLGMYQPDQGRIEVDGTPLTALDPDAWRARCTAAFQDFSQFNLAAVESVGLADLPRLDDEPAAVAALDRAGAGDLPGQLPDGLATYVGTAFTGGTGLSGGQWQKLALGRAMRATDPLLVVLDEPTASLDAPSEHALFERYAAAARDGAATGTVTVLVSHRFSTVRMADLIIFMDEGRAVEIGSHEDLLASGGRYAELFGLQADAYR